ncbi:MAG: hypothetical protein ACK47B_22415 [Armatimonadota bacterium]
MPERGLTAWLRHGGTPEEASHVHDAAKPWYLVLWLTGVDYFSTLGYQPGIALLAAGALSPFATALLVLFTLFGALPVYYQVAGRSYVGQGSIAMLERVLRGWRSKLVILVMLGFASTAFIFTVTLSSADAALHIVENPLVEPYFHGGGQLWVTLLLISLLTAVFLKGFSEAIGLAIAVGLPYILLNFLVVGRGLYEIATHPEALPHWAGAVTRAGDPVALLLLSATAFPKLALGLSGFETGVAVMPLVRGDDKDGRRPKPEGVIRNSRKLLAAAAIVMSVLLIGTSVVTAMLVPESAYRSGEASGRVLAYLTHRLMGPVVGTAYDISTILILWFAGASAITGMLNLIPRYLPRLGMAPRWVAYARPLVLVLFAAEVLVTLAFRAEVEAQAGAYATGVLALMLSASVAVSLALRHESGQNPSLRRLSFYFWLVTAGFIYAIADNVWHRPDGVIIAGLFIAAIIVLSAASRYHRATELRVERVVLEGPESAQLWAAIQNKKINLVPLKRFDPEATARKAEEIREHYRIAGPLAFLHVNLADDRSDFSPALRVRVSRNGEDYCIEVDGAVAIANAIAYLSELLDPISIFLGLTRRNTVAQAIRYLLWGEGETGIRVYEVLLRHWERTPEDDVRPRIYLMSEGSEEELAAST